MNVDKQMIIEARKTNLITFLEGRGFTLKKEGKNYRVKDFSGVLVKENMYTDFANRTDGNAIDFCTKVLHMDFVEAVHTLLQHGQFVTPILPAGAEPVVYSLPDRNKTSRRAIAYLTKTRGIARELVIELIKEGLLYEDSRGNAVFVCRDENGEAKEAIIRGTLTAIPFRKRIGIGMYPFMLYPDPQKTTLILTEAPIEALSIITIYPQSRNSIHAALGGVSLIEAVERLLNVYPHIQTIVVAFNNDEAGRAAGDEIYRKYGDIKRVQFFYPQADGEDWNDQVVIHKKRFMIFLPISF